MDWHQQELRLLCPHPRDDTDYSFLGWVQHPKQDFAGCGMRGLCNFPIPTELPFSQEHFIIIVGVVLCLNF